jgi:magnesium transporter
MSFFIELVRKPVLDPDGSYVGKLTDLIVTPSDPVPVVTAGVVATRREPRLVPWEELQPEARGYRLRRPLGSLPDYVTGPQDLRIGETILDRQIYDLNGARVVRVNDLRFAESRGRLCLVGVDAGLRGLLRRAGLERLAERAAGALRLSLHSQLIGWQDVETPDPTAGAIRLKVPYERIARLHPAEIASLLSQMDPAERRILINQLDVETAAEALPEVEPEMQVEIIQTLGDERAADILEAMEPDEAADLLGDLPEARKEELLDRMEEEEAAEVEELLEYDDLCAGGLMTNAFVAVPEGITIGHALELVREQAMDVDQVYYVYVLDPEERVAGVVSLRELLIGDPSGRIDEVMRTRIRVIDADASADDVRQTIAKYGLLSVPVVDNEEKLLGVVTIDDVLDLVIPAEWRLRPSRSHTVAAPHD